jgi:hypothetical protein
MKVYFEKIAGFFFGTCARVLVAHSLIQLAHHPLEFFFVVFFSYEEVEGKKVSISLLRHKVSMCAGVKMQNFSANIFTMQVNRARRVVRTVQNNHRCCSHFRILRNWDEKTRI